MSTLGLISRKIGCAPTKNIPYSRLIDRNLSDKKLHNWARSRFIDLKSKLQAVHRQFPEEKLNILFIFHFSLGESMRYLTQALFGASNFFKNKGEFVLGSGGLFYLEEWRKISACCLARINPDLNVTFPFAWKNPRALLQIPKPVLDTLCLKI